MPWWQEAVFYQVYPLSFQDSDGDGFGDLEGVISRLDYLAYTLGVDAIWVSPFYKSPFADWGYDVSDHTDVDPMFGDLSAAEKLIEAAHEHGLRIIFDYVMNHTSDHHPWFVESRSTRGNPKRDWYIWREPRPDGNPPNNWVSVFGGPMWTLDPTTDQYYRHSFLAEQPDVNWRNPEAVQAMLDVARFWLERGVDGFRVDAAHQIMKDPLERDNPPAPPDYVRSWKDMGEYDNFVHLYDVGHPDVHEAHRQFQAVLNSFGRQAMSVGEIHIFDLPEWASYYGEALDQLSMPFNFNLIAAAWDAESLRVVIEAVLWNLPPGAWTNWTLGNHDEPRLATRLGSQNVRLAALLLLTLPGTPFVYYGDELGMPDVVVGRAHSKDPWGDTVPRLSRDGCRSPMQWDASPNAGFTSGAPWLPAAPDCGERNVSRQLEQKDSILNLYRRLLAVRKATPALRRGRYLTHHSSSAEVLAFTRTLEGEELLVALNLSDEFLDLETGPGSILLSTHHLDRPGTIAPFLTLAPREGVILQLA